MKLDALAALAFSAFLLPLTGESMPFDWKSGVSGTVTRCYDTEDVKFHCEDFSDPDDKKAERVAELQIDAIDPFGRRYSYSYEKGLPRELCREHFRKIKSLLQKTKEACITGAPEWNAKDNSEITYAKWEAIETKRGRYVWW